MSESDVDTLLSNGLFDTDTFCAAYECDGGGLGYPYGDCPSDDAIETLTQHGGVAPGAKIAVFDWSYHANDFFVPEVTGNFLWNATHGTGARIHSNSWGFATMCQLTELEYLYDTYMYEVRYLQEESPARQLR